MGAEFQTMSVAFQDRKEAQRAFEEAQEQDRYDNGHSYSGGFGMATGLQFRDENFASEDAADEWLDEHAEKWGKALAVQVTSDGGSFICWRIGAICAA